MRSGTRTRLASHCDIKPANISAAALRRRQDPGFWDRAALRGAPAQTTEAQGGVAGTPGYMSPEQALGRTLDQRSDLFARGRPLRDAGRQARVRCRWRSPVVRCGLRVSGKHAGLFLLGPERVCRRRAIITALQGPRGALPGCGRVPTGAERGAARGRTDAGPGSGSATATSPQPSP